MTIKDIKLHGQQLGLEAELNTRINSLKAACEKRDWTWCYSHAVFIQELAEELRKVQDEIKSDDRGQRESSKSA